MSLNIVHKVTIRNYGQMVNRVKILKWKDTTIEWGILQEVRLHLMVIGDALVCKIYVTDVNVISAL